MKKLVNIVILFVFFSLYNCASMIQGHKATFEEVSQNTFDVCPSNYQDIIKEMISVNLKDPYSAKYRFGDILYYIYNGQNGQEVIVMVNAKNSYGAYIGEYAHMYFCYGNKIQEINGGMLGFIQGFARGAQ